MGKKRKSGELDTTPSTKKQKTENDKSGDESSDATNTLYLGNLPYHTTKESLQEFFKDATSIRMPLDYRGRPSGFAYVEFKSIKESTAALNGMSESDKEMDGRVINLAYARKKEALTPKQPAPGKPTKELFIGNLSPDTTEASLQEAFGNALSTRIAIDYATGESKRFGFAVFKTVDEAQKAQEAYHDQVLDGSQVRIQFAKESSEVISSVPPNTQLIVRNLDFEIKEERLSKIFSKAASTHIAVNKTTGESRGFAFLEFETIEDATSAKIKMHKQEIDGRKISVEYTKQKPGAPPHDSSSPWTPKPVVQKTATKKVVKKTAPKMNPTKELFIGQLKSSVTEEMLQELFTDAVGIKLPSSTKGKRMGYAFVQFNSVDQAEAARDKVNGTTLNGNELNVEFSKSRSDNVEDFCSKKLFVGGLSSDVTREEVEELFAEAENIEMPINAEGKSKGFVYVEYKTLKEAKAAKEELDKQEIGGHEINIEYASQKVEKRKKAKKKGDSEPKTVFVTKEQLRELFAETTNVEKEKKKKATKKEKPVKSRASQSKPTNQLCIGNIQSTMTAERMQQLFTNVAKVDMPTDSLGKPKGFAYLTFKSIDDASTAAEVYRKQFGSCPVNYSNKTIK